MEFENSADRVSREIKNQKRTILRKLFELVVLLEQIELFGLAVLRHCAALVVCDLTSIVDSSLSALKNYKA
jgi:hypothetical protein